AGRDRPARAVLAARGAAARVYRSGRAWHPGHRARRRRGGGGARRGSAAARALRAAGGRLPGGVRPAHRAPARRRRAAPAARRAPAGDGRRALCAAGTGAPAGPTAGDVRPCFRYGVASTAMNESVGDTYLPHLVGALRRRWRIVLLCAIVTPAVAYGLSVRGQKQYQAQAEILFSAPHFDQTLFGSSATPGEDPTRAAATDLRLV